MTATQQDIPVDANAHCPGPTAETAGKADACAGCPNQQQCASGVVTEDPAIELINLKMSTVDKKILVLSGKGGVGKSTFSTNLSWCLANDKQVGLLDLDLCGPSIPKMMGVELEQVHQSNSGWSPIYLDNLSIMSIGFMLPDPGEAVIWKGPKKNGLIKQFLKDVDWGELDYLVIDTPPGTSDEHISIAQYLKEGIVGAVVVTTPQEVALLDVRKEINFCKKVGIKILGVVENMAGFVCPNCSNETKIFKPSSGGAAKMCEEMNVEYLGSIPIDPKIAKACDLGENLFEDHGDSICAKSYLKIVEKIKMNL